MREIDTQTNPKTPKRNRHRFIGEKKVCFMMSGFSINILGFPGGSDG